MRFPESKLAHKLLDGLVGLEIGGSAHNAFGLNSRNVDYTSDMETYCKLSEKELCGEALAVDIVAQGDKLPVLDNSQDFVISSHVLEHFIDPIKALKEWYRVVRKGGYIFMIVPHKDRTSDKDKERTSLKNLIDRHHCLGLKLEDHYGHHSFWITEDILELMQYLKWEVVTFQNVDDKAGNGFTVVVKVNK
jgi:ubiquinone/menaquinone biosynthesis C-methylase UbiE